MKDKIMPVFAAVIAVFVIGIFLGSGTGADTVLAESEQVDPYNVTTDGVAFKFQNIANENVTVELIGNGSVQETVTVDVGSDGVGGTSGTGSTITVDRIRVNPADTNASEVQEVTHYYGYDGSAGNEGNTGNYQSSQVYQAFNEVTGEGTDYQPALVEDERMRTFLGLLGLAVIGAAILRVL